MQYAVLLSETISIAPVTATTAPVLAEKSFTNWHTLSRFSSATTSAESASTPFVVPLPAARVFISEIFPRMTANLTSFKSFKAVSVLSFEAPAPTGSRTTGSPSPLAFFPAASIDGMVRLLSVPMLILRPLHKAVISSTSAISSDIIGEPPQASRIFAQSFTVT